MSKRLDLVIWGATGFTGRLCAEYMANRYGLGKGVSWAIAGRNRQRLEQIKQDLIGISDSVRDLRIITADSHDKLSLKDMCEQAKVVVTTVGPYSKEGYELVDAAAESGTHYCDLTGEVPFIKRVIERYQKKAVDNHVKIVNCCGFDCIPVDLGTFLVCEHLRSQGAEIVQVQAIAGKIKGGISGGTVASGMEIIERSSWQELKQLKDPLVLLTDVEARPPSYNSAVGVKYNSILQAWTMPYIMAAIDIPLVQRSNAVMGFPYGRNFRYYESMSVPSLIYAVIGFIGLNLFAILTLFAPVRWLVKRAIRQGTGPSLEMQNTGFFNMHIIGEGIVGGRNVTVRGLVAAHGADPGYKLTAQMLCESALCLVFDESRLPARYGMLTPASAMGDVLINRLRLHANMRFDIVQG